MVIWGDLDLDMQFSDLDRYSSESAVLIQSNDTSKKGEDIRVRISSNPLAPSAISLPA
jgi:hypothetical protein